MVCATNRNSTLTLKVLKISGKEFSIPSRIAFLKRAYEASF